MAGVSAAWVGGGGGVEGEERGGGGGRGGMRDEGGWRGRKERRGRTGQEEDKDVGRLAVAEALAEAVASVAETQTELALGLVFASLSGDGVLHLVVIVLGEVDSGGGSLDDGLDLGRGRGRSLVSLLGGSEVGSGLLKDRFEVELEHGKNCRVVE